MTSDASQTGVPAIVSYIAASIFVSVTTGVFVMVLLGRSPTDAMAPLVGALVNAATNAVAAVWGYWLAASNSSNLAATQQRAVIAQAAGATPPALPVADKDTAS